MWFIMVNTISLQEKKMPNSDNTYGTFNKTTKILSQTGGSDVSWPLWTPTIFSTVEEAKSHFFSTEALAIWDECCTTLEWALLADGNGDNTKLKVTYDFGTKGTPTIAEASDWCGQYNSRQQALIDSGNWSNIGYTTEDSTDHLF
jgi:hypothetical protein